MFALGVAALAGFIGPMAASEAGPTLTYRLPPSAPTQTVERATPAMDRLFEGADRRGRRDARHVAGVTLAVEGARTRRSRGADARLAALPGGLRNYGARQSKAMTLAAAAEWDAGGHWRMSGGFDRTRLADAALPRGRTGTTTTVAALDYQDDAGLLLGGGWRVRGGGGAGPDRLTALAAGASLQGAGPFVRAAWPLEGMDVQVEASSAQLGGGDAALLGATSDRRLAFSLHRGFR